MTYGYFLAFAVFVLDFLLVFSISSPFRLLSQYRYTQFVFSQSTTVSISLSSAVPSAKRAALLAPRLSWVAPIHNFTTHIVVVLICFYCLHRSLIGYISDKVKKNLIRLGFD